MARRDRGGGAPAECSATSATVVGDRRAHEYEKREEAESEEDEEEDEEEEEDEAYTE